MFTTTNHYGGTCVICKKYVGPREGLSASTHGKSWSTRHISCTPEVSKNNRYATRVENFYRVLHQHLQNYSTYDDGSILTESGGTVTASCEGGEFLITYETPFGGLHKFTHELEWSMWLSKAGYTEETL